MYNSINITFELPSMSIAAQKWGEDGKPIILALHGWLDSSSSFNLLAPHISSEYQLIAIDLPGHGLSNHYAKESFFHYVDYIVEVKQIINLLNQSPIIIMGHSMGGSIVSMLAGTYPELFKQVILLDALGSFSADPKLAPVVLRKAISELEHLPNKRIPSYASLEEACAARLKATPMNDESVKALVSRTLKLCEDGRYRWRNDPRLMLSSPYYLTEDQVDAFLKNITADVLLISSNSGWPFGFDKYDTRVNCVKNITTIRLDANHHFHMDHAKMVGETIINFLND